VPLDDRASAAIEALGDALPRAPGARELVRLRDRVHYNRPGIVIGRTLAGLERELGIPLGELEDAFGGPALEVDLTLRLSVGPFEALVTVGDDLRRVRTSWIGGTGSPCAAVRHARSSTRMSSPSCRQSAGAFRHT